MTLSVPGPASRIAAHRPRISLRVRVLVGVAVTMAVGVGLIYALGSTTVTGGFQNLEQKDATVSVSRVQDALNQQVDALDLVSAQALFAMTLAVTGAGQDYLIESIASNEAFGQVYLYRLLLREARQQAV